LPVARSVFIEEMKPSNTPTGNRHSFRDQQGAGDVSEFRDVYSRITNKLIANLEWGAPGMESPAGKIMHPLRHKALPIRVTISSCRGASVAQ
jgi:hypothetical protein